MSCINELKHRYIYFCTDECAQKPERTSVHLFRLSSDSQHQTQQGSMRVRGSEKNLLGFWNVGVCYIDINLICYAFVNVYNQNGFIGG